MKTSFRPLKEISKTTAKAQCQPYAVAARRFTPDWAHETDEKGEAHSFWDEFLLIFNIRRRNFARHEARAKRSDDRLIKLIRCNFEQFRVYDVGKPGKALIPMAGNCRDVACNVSTTGRKTTLANLFAPNKMPAELLTLHKQLDAAVNACYGVKKGVGSEAWRVGWLFGRWGEVVETPI